MYLAIMVHSHDRPRVFGGIPGCFFLFNGLIGKIRSERMSCNVTVVLCCFWVRNVYSS